MFSSDILTILDEVNAKCILASVKAEHDRVKEEYRQISRHIMSLIDEVKFAGKLEKILLSDNIQFVAVDGDNYRPISAVEAISKIEQIDINSLFSNKFRR